MPASGETSGPAKRTGRSKQRDPADSRRADRARPQRTIYSLLFLLVALALALRLWGITDHLPDPSLRLDPTRDTSIDETDRRATAHAWEMWRGGTRPFDPNPHRGEWPALTFYVTLLLQVTYRFLHSVTTGTWSATEFAAHVQDDPRGIFLAGRLGGVLIGTASVWLTYLLGARTLGRTTGLLAAAFIATGEVHVMTSQHVSDPNLLALLFVTLAALALARVRQGGGMAISAVAGAMIGLAGASKYVPLALIPLLALGGDIPRRETEGGRVRILWGSLTVGFGAALVVFFAASPFTLLDWGATVQDLAAQRERHLSEWLGQTRYVVALPDYVIRVLPSMLGWPAYALAVIGGVSLMWRRRGAEHLVLVPILLLLANGFLSVAQPRFILPALSCLALLAAYPIVRSAEIAGRLLHSTGRGAALAGLLGIMAAAVPLRALVAARQDLGRPDSRHVARAWIDRHIDPAIPTATEAYGPVYGDEGNARAVVTWPFFAEQAELVRIAYRVEWLDGLGYYVVSGGVAGRYEIARLAYPAEWRYYEWLGARAPTVWKSDADSMSGPRIEIRRLPSSISTRATRDSLWGAVPADPRAQEQLALWCSAMARAFRVADDFERSQEWAKRGLTIERSAARRSLCRVLAFAYLRGERVQELLVHTGAALREFPEDDALQLYRAMALDAAGEYAQALAAYQESLRLNPSQPQAERIRLQIRRLGGLMQERR